LKKLKLTTGVKMILKNLYKIILAIVVLKISVLSANVLNENDTNYSKNVSRNSAYQLPTLNNKKPDFYQFNDSYKRAKKLNHTEIFNKVMGCFPSVSNFDIDVSFKAGLNAFERTSDGLDNSQQKFYAGLVFKLPLYSTSENSRVREQEYKRRQDISKLVASLSKSVTERNLSIRMIALYTSLERREQLRIAGGVEQKKGSIVTVDNQIKYLEKIAKQEQIRILNIVEIESTKLQLVAHCSKNSSNKINKYLTNIINNI